jgi:hypothetical protein
VNYSIKHKTIWWAPERCATKALAKVFSNFEFSYKMSEDLNPRKLLEPYHSHEIFIPEEFSDFEVICSMRNPYDRVLSLFTNFDSVGRTTVYTKNNKETLINNFNYFVDGLLSYADVRKLEPDPNKNKMLKKYITKYEFETRVPDLFIRVENLLGDLEKVDFIRESDEWVSGKIKNYLTENEFIRKRPYKFNQIYTFETAQKVYNYFQKHFFICDYDPFSFTEESLSDYDKKKFLHGIIL